MRSTPSRPRPTRCRPALGRRARPASPPTSSAPVASRHRLVRPRRELLLVREDVGRPTPWKGGRRSVPTEGPLTTGPLVERRLSFYLCRRRPWRARPAVGSEHRLARRSLAADRGMTLAGFARRGDGTLTGAAGPWLARAAPSLRRAGRMQAVGRDSPDRQPLPCRTTAPVVGARRRTPALGGATTSRSANRGLLPPHRATLDSAHRPPTPSRHLRDGAEPLSGELGRLPPSGSASRARDSCRRSDVVQAAARCSWAATRRRPRAELRLAVTVVVHPDIPNAGEARRRARRPRAGGLAISTALRRR